jgi:tripartite-type tricarboxylate transporter receptor subunit TctC
MDPIARLLTETAKKYFPQRMVVMNRGGGAGTIGTAEIIGAKPDGYTIGITAVAVLTVQPHRTKLPYGSPEGYTPILRIMDLPICFAVRSDAPWKNIQGFLSYAKQNPGKIRLGNTGMGTIVHIVGEEFKSMAKIDCPSVPFDGGGEQMPAFLGGHVEAVVTHHAVIAPHVKAGKVRVLGVFEERRNRLFPDAPTFRELGYDLTRSVYYLVIGPKGLSAEIVSVIHDSLKKAQADPAFVNPMEARGNIVTYEGPEALKARLLMEYQKNAKLVEMIGLKGK